MKLYRVRSKTSFTTRTKADEWETIVPDVTSPPVNIQVLPGVKVKVCEMVAAHWATRSKEIPEHDDVVITVNPEWTEKVVKTVPGYWHEEKVEIPGHWETKKKWIPEYETSTLKRVDGYYKDEKVLVPEHTVTKYRTVPGYYVLKDVWVDAHYVTIYYWQEPHPARGLPGQWKSYEQLVSSRFEEQKVWVPATKESYQEVIPKAYVVKPVWIPAYWVPEKVTVPGQFRDVKVWIPQNFVRKQVWIPATTKIELVLHEKEVIKTIVSVPVKTVSETYWQYENLVCHVELQEQFQSAGVTMSASQMKAVGDWFAWYQTTTVGQVYMQTVLKAGWLEKYTAYEVALEAYNSFRVAKPDISVTVAGEAVLKFRPQEFANMMQSSKGVAYLRSQGMYDMAKKVQGQIIARNKTEWTAEELSLLVGAAKVAVLLAAIAGVVYWAWPIAKFEYGVTYSDWVYVLRYKEEFSYADLVGVSALGKPTYWITDQKGGPIMSEERTFDTDTWKFGEMWKWSSYVEEGTYLGIGETIYWTEMEVEYLGMVSKSGAEFYVQHDNITFESTGGHDKGWMKPVDDWGKWQIIEDHVRVNP